MGEWWEYDELKSGEPYDWSHAAQGDNPFDNIDFHLDIGMGTLKKGRLGIDRHLAPGVDLVMDLETLEPAELTPDEGFRHQKTIDLFHHLYSLDKLPVGKAVLPFPTDSIKSIISHHCMEHLLFGFVPLIDECYRILEPGGVLRIITPLFPSRTAVEDPDHKRWIMAGTFDTFVGSADGSHWHEAFSVPYTGARFEMANKDITVHDPPLALDELWGESDAREIRVALRKPRR